MSTSGYPYCYYKQDHLGSNREVNSYAGTTGTVVQQTEYYPSGTAYVEGTGAGIQPFKFTGKELIIMHGLNWQDYGARWLDNVRMQWTTMDQKSETYYNWSPYVYCKNNSIKLIDSNGKRPGDPLSTGVPAQQQSNGTWTMAQASTYIPTHQILETKTIPLEDRLKIMLPASSGTITATETNLQKTLDATADNPMTQLETSPVIQGVAAVSAVAMVGAAAPEIISAAVSAVTETAVSVTTAVNNSTTLTAIAGVSAGFVNSQLPQDAPQVTATPIFNTFQAGSQAFFVFMQLLTTSNQKPQPPKKDEKH
jgi:RHS repeat-associated protein